MITKKRDSYACGKMIKEYILAPCLRRLGYPWTDKYLNRYGRSRELKDFLLEQKAAIDSKFNAAHGYAGDVRDQERYIRAKQRFEIIKSKLGKFKAWEAFCSEHERRLKNDKLWRAAQVAIHLTDPDYDNRYTIIRAYTAISPPQAPPRRSRLRRVRH